MVSDVFFVKFSFSNHNLYVKEFFAGCAINSCSVLHQTLFVVETNKRITMYAPFEPENKNEEILNNGITGNLHKALMNL